MNNAQTIYQTARSEGAPDVVARLMVAQSEHETAAWTSPVFIDDHNGFGMKVPSIRKDPFIKGPSVHTRTSEGSTPYAHYDNLADSTRSLINWIRYNKIAWTDIDTPDKYAEIFKSKGYYGDTLDNYLRSLTRYFNQVKGMALKYNKQVVLALAGIGLIGLGILAYMKFKK